MPRCRIIVAGDAGFRNTLVAGLVADGYTVDTACCAREAFSLMGQQDYAVSVLELGDGEGFETVNEIRSLRPDCSILVLSGPDSRHNGAKIEGLEIALKPCTLDDVSARIRRMAELQNLRRENAALREQLARQVGPVTPVAGMKVREMEKVLITATIRHTGGNLKEAASVLGIDRSTLYEKIKRYDIPRR